MALKMALDHVAILVEDLGRSVHFYCKILELPIAKTLEAQGTKTVFVQAADAMISLSTPKGEGSKSPSKGPQGTGLRSISFRVQNVEEAWRELLGRGVIFTSGPERAEGGHMKAVFTDPNGVLLELVQWSEQ